MFNKIKELVITCFWFILAPILVIIDFVKSNLSLFIRFVKAFFIIAVTLIPIIFLFESLQGSDISKLLSIPFHILGGLLQIFWSIAREWVILVFWFCGIYGAFKFYGDYVKPTLEKRAKPHKTEE